MMSKELTNAASGRSPELDQSPSEANPNTWGEGDGVGVMGLLTVLTVLTVQWKDTLNGPNRRSLFVLEVKKVLRMRLKLEG